MKIKGWQALLILLAVVAIGYWLLPHFLQDEGPRVADSLAKLTKLPPSSFADPKCACSPPRMMCNRYCFTASPEVIQKIVEAWSMAPKEARPIPSFDLQPSWWAKGTHQPTNDLIYFYGFSIGMWVVPKEGRCYVYNYRGT